MVLCDSMNAGLVVRIPRGVGTLKRYLMQKNCTFALTGGRDAITSHHRLYPSHGVKLSLTIFLI